MSFGLGFTSQGVIDDLIKRDTRSMELGMQFEEWKGNHDLKVKADRRAEEQLGLSRNADARAEAQNLRAQELHPDQVRKGRAEANYWETRAAETAKIYKLNLINGVYEAQSEEARVTADANKQTSQNTLDEATEFSALGGPALAAKQKVTSSQLQEASDAQSLREVRAKGVVSDEELANAAALEHVKKVQELEKAIRENGDDARKVIAKRIAASAGDRDGVVSVKSILEPGMQADVLTLVNETPALQQAYGLSPDREITAIGVDPSDPNYLIFQVMNHSMGTTGVMSDGNGQGQNVIRVAASDFIGGMNNVLRQFDGAVTNQETITRDAVTNLEVEDSGAANQLGAAAAYRTEADSLAETLSGEAQTYQQIERQLSIASEQFAAIRSKISQNGLPSNVITNFQNSTQDDEEYREEARMYANRLFNSGGLKGTQYEKPTELAFDLIEMRRRQNEVNSAKTGLATSSQAIETNRADIQGKAAEAQKLQQLGEAKVARARDKAIASDYSYEEPTVSKDVLKMQSEQKQAAYDGVLATIAGHVFPYSKDSAVIDFNMQRAQGKLMTLIGRYPDLFDEIGTDPTQWGVEEMNILTGWLDSTDGKLGKALRDLKDN